MGVADGVASRIGRSQTSVAPPRRDVCIRDRRLPVIREQAYGMTRRRNAVDLEGILPPVRAGRRARQGPLGGFTTKKWFSWLGRNGLVHSTAS